MVKRVSKRVSEIVFLIAAGGSIYYLIEIWFRGFSHWTMFVLHQDCEAAQPALLLYPERKTDVGC